MIRIEIPSMLTKVDPKIKTINPIRPKSRLIIHLFKATGVDLGR